MGATKRGGVVKRGRRCVRPAGMQGFELAASAGAGGAGCHGAVAEISGPVGTALAVSAGQEARFMDMRPKKRPLHRKARCGAKRK